MAVTVTAVAATSDALVRAYEVSSRGESAGETFFHAWRGRFLFCLF